MDDPQITVAADHRQDLGSVGSNTAVTGTADPQSASGTTTKTDSPLVSVNPPLHHPAPVLPPMHLPHPHLPPFQRSYGHLEGHTHLHNLPLPHPQPGPYAFPPSHLTPYLYPHGHGFQHQHQHQPQHQHQQHHHQQHQQQQLQHEHPSQQLPRSHPSPAPRAPHSAYDHPVPPTWTLPPGHPFLPQCLRFHLVPWLSPELASAVLYALSESGANVVEDPNDAHLIVINPSRANRHHISPLNALPSVRNGTTRIVPYDWFFRSHYSRISSDIERSLLFVDARQEPLLVALAKGLQADSSSTRMQLVTLIQDNGGVVVTPKACQVYIVDKPDSESAIEKAKNEGCPENAERKSLEWVIGRWEKSLVKPFRAPRPGESTTRPPPPPQQPANQGQRHEVKVTGRKGSKAPTPQVSPPQLIALADDRRSRASGKKADAVPAASKKRETPQSTSDRPGKVRKTTDLPTPYTKIEEAQGLSPYTPGSAAFLQGLPGIEGEGKEKEGGEV